MRQAGWNISQLARQLGRHPATIHKYFYATTFPEHKPHRTGRSILDPYLSYLEQRVQDGCENAQQLWREIQQQGYPGTNRQVMKWLQLKRTCPAPHTPHTKGATKHPASRKATLPSSKQLAWLLVRDTGSLSQSEQTLLSHLHQHDVLSQLYDHLQVFTKMVKHWNNGQTEGQVNRLKFIKHQMYGRAKFNLLRL